jgi:hypothetical protein
MEAAVVATVVETVERVKATALETEERVKAKEEVEKEANFPFSILVRDLAFPVID